MAVLAGVEKFPEYFASSTKRIELMRLNAAIRPGASEEDQELGGIKAQSTRSQL